MNFIEVEEFDGRQKLKLPSQVCVQAKRFRVVQSGEDLILSPANLTPTSQEFDACVAELQKMQLELGNLFPEGRQQPEMPVTGVLFTEE